MGLLKSVLFISCVQLIGYTQATIQLWLPNTNFENPDNWNVKRVPCGNDVVIIPDESPVVYLQVNTTIKELVMPKNGELILGQNANIGFTQNTRPNCPSADGDVEFIAVHPKSWLNPSSWCSKSTEQGPCDTSTPKLDVEKVPCSYDDVVMPRYHSYFIDLSEGVPELTVKSLKIAGSSFTTSSFSTYLTNADGSRMFKTASQQSSRTNLKITRKTCDDKNGCTCGNDQAQISKKICSHVQKTCSRPRCKNTIQPVGACCRMCGAVFNITRGYGYDYQDFKNQINKNFYTDQMKKDINMTVFLTSEGWVQIALNDRTGERSADLAKQMKADMEEDLSKGGHKYAIDGVQLMLSMGSPIGPPSSHSGSAMSSGSVAGIVIGLIVILILMGLIVIFFVFKRTGREMPKIPSISMPSVSMPSMPRFPRRMMPKAMARVPAQPHTAAHVDPGFANPLYDTSPFDDGNAVVKEMELMSAGQEDEPTFGLSAGGGFNNPLYGTQGAMFDDPTKAADSHRKKDDSSAAAATGSAKATADIPAPESSAKMILVDINDESGTSNI